MLHRDTEYRAAIHSVKLFFWKDYRGNVASVATKLSSFLKGHPKYRGLSVSQIGRCLGIERSVASRILSGSVVPSPENMLRIAASLEEHPAKLYELAGMPEIAELFRTVCPPPDHPLQQKMVRLMALGLGEQIEQCLEIIEGAAKKKVLL